MIPGWAAAELDTGSCAVERRKIGEFKLSLVDPSGG
jgi:hypothetical protein